MNKLLCNSKEWCIVCNDNNMISTTTSNGVVTTTSMDAYNIETMFISEFLPMEGVGGKRDFALYVAKIVEPLVKGFSVRQCLEIVQQRVYNQSVSDSQLKEEYRILYGYLNKAREQDGFCSYNAIICIMVAASTTVSCHASVLYAQYAFSYSYGYIFPTKKIYRKLLEIIGI